MTPQGERYLSEEPLRNETKSQNSPKQRTQFTTTVLKGAVNSNVKMIILLGKSIAKAPFSTSHDPNTFANVKQTIESGAAVVEQATTIKYNPDEAEVAPAAEMLGGFLIGGSAGVGKQILVGAAKRTLKRSVKRLSRARLKARDANSETGYVKVKGKTDKPEPHEVEAYRKSERSKDPSERVERGRVEYSDGTVSERVGGPDDIYLGPEKGKSSLVRRNYHTHVKSEIALPSLGDVVSAQMGYELGYWAVGAEFRNIGKKWPFMNKLLKEMGYESMVSDELIAYSMELQALKSASTKIKDRIFPSEIFKNIKKR
jgi:hypothetical protein